MKRKQLQQQHQLHNSGVAYARKPLGRQYVTHVLTVTPPQHARTRTHYYHSLNFN